MKKKFFFMLFAMFVVTGIIVIRWANGFFLFEIPATGGIYAEGIVGAPRFINPLLAISDADYAMTNLVYSGLMRPDGRNGLVLDLAEKYEISEDRLSYVFTLKNNLEWQDGKPITSDDVVFTIQQAKNSSVKSPKRAGWEGIDVEKIDDRNIRFSMQRAYAPFLENTTLGILPKHLWKEVLPEQMILSEFNIRPIGSGPYKIAKLNRNSSGIIDSYELSPNDGFSLGAPYIQKIIMRFYVSEKDLLAAFKNKEIDGVSAVSPKIAAEIKKAGTTVRTMSLPRVFGVFFNQNNAEIFSKNEVRAALNLATNKDRIINEVIQGFGVKLNYPIPPGVFGAVERGDSEGELSFSIEKAKDVLQKNGWKFNEGEKIWEKKNSKKEVVRLEFSLSTSDTPELTQSAELLKSMWEELGAKVNLKIFEIGDLNQNVIRPRKYDALLFGEMVGRDPDPFSFWHSSQRNDPGLNIAMYTNIAVDKLLEEARTTIDAEARAEKYEKFQKQVAADNVAVFLYSPRFIYLLPTGVKRAEDTSAITTPAERFSQIYKWYINTRKTWKIFARQE